MRPEVREVRLRPRAPGGRLAAGHPWIWRDSIAHGLDGTEPGAEVQVALADGTLVGRGLADPASALAVRMWTHGRSALVPALWRERVERAASLRSRFVDIEQTNAYRLLHGEGDRMPGFVVDRYGSVAILRTDGDAAWARARDLVTAIGPTLRSLGVTTLVHRHGGKGQAPRLEVLVGTAAPDVVHVRENGLAFAVDLAHGQKTGAFLDQRDNRARVRELAQGRRVLNLFSYAGGFSLYAAAGGASHVTSVDTATGAHATAHASFRASGLDTSAHAFVTADVFAFLDTARLRGETWDLVVSDPPSFAPSEKALPRALAAYRKLHRACASVVAPGGVLCAASCSSHVTLEAFLGTLDDAALARDDLRIVEVRGAGPDHPVLPAFPEGRYLEFVVLA